MPAQKTSGSAGAIRRFRHRGSCRAHLGWAVSRKGKAGRHGFDEDRGCTSADAETSAKPQRIVSRSDFLCPNATACSTSIHAPAVSIPRLKAHHPQLAGVHPILFIERCETLQANSPIFLGCPGAQREASGVSLIPSERATRSTAVLSSNLNRRRWESTSGERTPTLRVLSAN